MVETVVTCQQLSLRHKITVCATDCRHVFVGAVQRRSPEHSTRSRKGWAASSQAGRTSWWEDLSSPESPSAEAVIHRDRNVQSLHLFIHLPETKEMSVLAEAPVFPLTMPYPIMPVGVVAGKLMIDDGWSDRTFKI